MENIYFCGFQKRLFLTGGKYKLILPKNMSSSSVDIIFLCTFLLSKHSQNKLSSLEERMVVTESAPDSQWIKGIKHLHIFVSYNSNLVNVSECLS